MSDDTEWDPQPATLRDGETRDDTSHARKNIEQLKLAEDNPRFSPEKRQEVRERRLELEAELDEEGGEDE